MFIRRFATVSSPKQISEKAASLVTTPIFYVNASPHLGHLYSALVADAICRYNNIKNPTEKFILSTGTDEHGTKVEQAANNNKISVKSYCDKISQNYSELFNSSGVNYTRFIRTTEEDHKKSVQHFWNVLKAKNHIKLAKYSGWYCVSDETFITDSQLKTNPDGTKVSLESGHPAQWTEETNYIFELDKFKDNILYWIKKGNRIRPAKFEKILLDLFDEPHGDLSVSRPRKRVQWGIPVPDDDSQVVYVWLDALVNYLTCAGYPDTKFMNIWPPKVHVLGKDILKFHGMYWPAFLIAAGLEPPECLLVHSHWTVDGEKMSKSKFNVVDPFKKSELYTMEGLRYFLLREGVAHSDGNYSDVKALRILNSELADTIGNLLSRCCAKSLNPRQVFPKLHKEHFHGISQLDYTKHLIELLSILPDQCAHDYEAFNFYLVVDKVMKVLHAANNFFENSRPWELKRTPEGPPDTEGDRKLSNAQKLETIISLTMETLRICGIILQPIIPEMSKKLLNKLNIDDSYRNWTNLESFSWNILDKNEEKSLNTTCDSVLFRRIITKDSKK